ncbi:MAG TPA: GNAT family N-acetyltransferase [Terracidiphilus sp.]|jgi:ribosomal-protein-alanine N-acetyltransferase
MSTELCTERLILRSWRHSDREPFARLNADPHVMEYFPATLSRAQSDVLVDRIETDLTQRGYGLSAAELRDTGEFIGFIGLSVPTFEAHFTSPAHPAVEIGWRLAAEHWGKGLATEGARAVLDHAFNHLHLSEVVSFTTAANLRSRHVMEKIGMERDPADDFEHPGLPAGHSLRSHVLYRKRAGNSQPIAGSPTYRSVA